jgi:hypothetical protein
VSYAALEALSQWADGAEQRLSCEIREVPTPQVSMESAKEESALATHPRGPGLRIPTKEVSNDPAIPAALGGIPAEAMGAAGAGRSRGDSSSSSATRLSSSPLHPPWISPILMLGSDDPFKIAFLGRLEKLLPAFPAMAWKKYAFLHFSTSTGRSIWCAILKPFISFSGQSGQFEKKFTSLPFACMR